ncbi:MAG TPA: hypothetical protein VH329_05800 [Solirubrobacterales bacterium]|jgi:hypothetical protein
MAARRLLIVMLVLLGLSTLAAALVPQRTLRDGATNSTTTTTAQATTTTAPLNPAFRRPTKITVGKSAKGKKLFPQVRANVGDQFTLLVRSSFPTQLEIPEFGLISFATPNTPARFELLTDTPGTFGILFGASAKAGIAGKPAAQIAVVREGAKEQKKAERPKKKAKSKS